MKPVKVVLRTGGKRKIRENMEEVNLIKIIVNTYINVTMNLPCTPNTC
jgi:hypothetical protein